jgi:hypothetical protein
MLRILIFSLAVLLFVSTVPVDRAFCATKKKQYSKRKKKSSRKRKRSRARPKARKKPKSKDIVLSTNTIYRHAKRVALSGVSTKIPQIDILRVLFYKYREDPRIVKQRQRMVVTGYHFGKAYVRAERIFKGPKKSGKVFKSAKQPARIRYKNFKSIILFRRKRTCRIAIHLKKSYTQELPHTFGAKIGLKKDMLGILRSNKSGLVTEVVFDNNKSVLFQPPGIAFFVPEVWVKIATVSEIKGEIFGYVIGRPKNDPKKYVAIRYNLTTCAKTSIKTYKLSPREFRKKRKNVNYFGFLR